jgi:hypothetical protein
MTARRCIHLQRGELPAAVLVRVERHAEAPDSLSLDLSAEIELCPLCVGMLHQHLGLLHAQGMPQ